MANGILWQLAAQTGQNYANLPNVIRQAQDHAQNREMLSARQDLPMIAPDQRAEHLLGAGDLQGASILQQLALAQADRQWRQQEANRAQTNVDREFNFKTQAANVAEIREIKNPDGSTSLVRIDRTGNAAPVNTGPQPPPSNPFAPNGKMNDSQSTSALYADRMVKAHEVISKLETINQGPAGFAGGIVSNVGGNNPLVNSMLSPERQTFQQAQRDFINAVLRKESGAVISESEFANARQQYFPQAGDTPQVLAQKRQNRQTAIEGLMRSAGPGYRPPAGFGPQPQQAPQAPQSPQAQPQAFSEGQVAVNPQTGQRIRFQGGQWVPAQ